MALLFFDGFDHYAIGDILKKWTTFAQSDRCSIITNPRGGKMIQIGHGSFGGTFFIRKSFVTSYTTLYCGFAIYGCTATLPIVMFYSDTTLQVDLRVDALGRIYATRNGTTIGTPSVPLIDLSSCFHCEVKVYIHDTNGTIDVNINGAAALSLTGLDTRNGTPTTVNSVVFQTTGYSILKVGDIWIDDSKFLGDCKIETIYPTAAGDTTAWTPSAGDNYACVDEDVPNSDTDYVSSATAGQVDTYAFGDLTITTGVVKGVQAFAFARKDDAGDRSIALVARPVSTDIVGDTVALADSYTYLTQLWELNPEDSAAWEIADINGAKFGVKMVS
jgi:hypothetical protein